VKGRDAVSRDHETAKLTSLHLELSFLSPISTSRSHAYLLRSTSHRVLLYSPAKENG
jgi:hypothetical protein